MFIVYLMQWWYGPGWVNQWKKIAERAKNTGRAYSGKTLLKTMFSPWKRIISYNGPNSTVQQKLQGVVDNLVSRLVGAIVRLFTLLAAFVLLIIVTFAGVALALIWPVIPLLSIAAIFKAMGML